MTKTADEAAAPAKLFSIADMEAQVASEETFEFEPLLPDGVTPSGVTFKLKSDLAPSVDARLKDLLCQMKRREQLRAAAASKSRPGEVTEDYGEMDVMGRRMIAARIAGWSMADEFTEANVLRVLKVWTGLSDQIIGKTADLARFTPASPKA